MNVSDTTADVGDLRRSILAAAKAGAAVGFFCGLPLAALLTRIGSGAVLVPLTILLWPVFLSLLATAFGAAAYLKGRRWQWPPLRFDERHRTGAAWSLILISPAAAALVATSALRVSTYGFMPGFIDAATPFFALATSPLAAIGPAAGALLLRLPIVLRVGLGMAFGFVGFVAFWAIDEVLMHLFGFI